MVVVRPPIKMNRGMDEMLHSVKANRAFRSRNIEKSFDAQNVASVAVDEQRQPDGKG